MEEIACTTKTTSSIIVQVRGTRSASCSLVHVMDIMMNAPDSRGNVSRYVSVGIV
jgi:hypothetical protein